MRKETVNAAAWVSFLLACIAAILNQEGLLPANRNFAGLLQQRQFKFEFHVVPGGHDWSQWNGRLDDSFHSLLEHLRT